mgnify:CR=1 FL=1|tara:strand:- start:543 stop:1502 length:960 start_codon:yes stop_codon:yes gene_type:complete
MEKYITDPKHVKEIIEKYGVAIVPDVLNEKELINMRIGMWDYLEHISQKFETPINRDKEETWKEFLKLYPKHAMLLQNCQVGHAQFIWDIRQNSKIVDIFSEIWECPKGDLLTSFDGASFHFPPELSNRGWFRKLWYHTDQSYLRPNFECIQSWVTGYDVNEGDATLSFMEGSNKYHKEFQETFNIQDKTDWFRIEEEEQMEFYRSKGCKDMKITCPAGSMVLWDSRTIHCGTEPYKTERKKINIREVVYICMTPRSLSNDRILDKRKKAFEEMRMTNHWPHKPKLFPEGIRTYGGPLPEIVSIDKPVLNELGKKLVGY